MIRIGFIGFGYWGPNIVRNFSRVKDASLVWICDVNPAVLASVAHIYPAIKTTKSYHDVLNDESVDAIVIATPTSLHFKLASVALRAGKHVLVEKPMTQTVKEAKELVKLAKRKKKILMVDHTFVYTPALQKLKSIIHQGTLGDIFYVDSVRTNLGILQKDANVIYDLATHDFAIMNYLFGKNPKTISATGITQKQLKQETVAHIGARYDNNLFIHCHVSWLSPIKIRRMIFVGTKKMLTFDDIEPSEKLKIYDKGISFIKDPKQSYQLRIGYRSGSAIVPHIDIEEGLFGVAKEFVKAVRTNTSPISDGSMGLSVVTCLACATKSLRMGGKPVRV